MIYMSNDLIKATIQFSVLLPCWVPLDIYQGRQFVLLCRVRVDTIMIRHDNTSTRIRHN